MTEYQTVGNNKHLFLTVLEKAKFKIKVPADVVSEESHLPGLQGAVFSRARSVESREGGSKLSCASCPKITSISLMT